MEKPPKSILEEGSDHHLIVALAYIAPVVEGLRLDGFVGSQLLCPLLDVLDRLLADLLVKYFAGVVVLRLEFVLSIDHPYHVVDQLLLYGICILSYFQSSWHQLVLSQLHSKSLAQLYGIRDILDSP